MSFGRSLKSRIFVFRSDEHLETNGKVSTDVDEMPLQAQSAFLAHELLALYHASHVVENMQALLHLI